MRHRAKLDANQTAIVDALRKAGCTVQSLAAVGGGVPDILVGWLGDILLMEIKDGTLSPSRRELTPDQIKWHAAWNGTPVAVVKSVDEALRAINEQQAHHEV